MGPARQNPAITCLMRGTIGEIVAAPGGAELSIDVVNESAAVATACGHKPSEKVLSRHAAAMTTPGSLLTSSMYRDLRKGAPVEADQILGDFIERGSARGVTTPLLNAAFVNLRVYQDRLPKPLRLAAPRSLFCENNYADRGFGVHAAAIEDVAAVLSKKERLTLERLLNELDKHAAETGRKNANGQRK